MNLSSWSFEFANKNLRWIILIGLGLGVANIALGVWPTLGQSLFQSLSISLVIGYGIILIADNSQALLGSATSDVKKYGFMLIAFVVIGIIGTEVEELVRRFAFSQDSYQFLDLGGKHLFNCILSVILGGVVFNAINLRKGADEIAELSHGDTQIPKLDPNSKEPLLSIPIRKNETFILHPIEKIIYFEAYDNYSFLHDLEGEKHLCNYSLLFLSKRLERNFIRVHRKYLVHKNQISKITPHLKGRYVIEFGDSSKTSITSSTTYSDVVKSLIKL